MYFADFHVHSKYSIATAKDSNLIELARWACMKGLKVVATGDFTHPKWSEEIKELLTSADDGLFRLKDEHLFETSPVPDGFGPEDVRFILSVEISSIYKKDGAVRKVHNLVYMPDFAGMEKFNSRLEKIGNIRSDGRPILGLDSRDLLEIAMESSAESFLIPAHVWTPWFSVLGSKSGFDSIEDCFEDLSQYVFALETGLSSDPEMNYMVSSLDKFTLVSNSDIHSPSKLGRECNIFEGVPGYAAIKEALKSGPLKDAATGAPEIGWSVDSAKPGFVGTIEFFPEEGKYHLDGHRKCSMRLEPEDTAKYKGRCPVCGGILTVGVMNRVAELADRTKGALHDRSAPFWRIVPLLEIIAESLGVRSTSKKALALYWDTLLKAGQELNILWRMPLAELQKVLSPLIVEGIRRVRQEKLIIRPGYDGEYGTVELFGPGEREHLAGQDTFFPTPSAARQRKKTAKGETTPPHAGRKKKRIEAVKAEEDEPQLNQEQTQATLELDRPVLVQAGPGTGKTRTLSYRIAHLIKEASAPPNKITAVTFTRKASEEMRRRLSEILPSSDMESVWVGTFHQLGTRLLEFFAERGLTEKPGALLDEEQAFQVFREAADQVGMKLKVSELESIFDELALAKQNLMRNERWNSPQFSELQATYERLLLERNACDFNDLLTRPVDVMRKRPEEAKAFGTNFAAHLLIDEFQDVNRAQYEMARLIMPASGKGIFAIGDPDQAIYGFRGSDAAFFRNFSHDYPETRRVTLLKNYRSGANIIKAAYQALGNDEGALTAQKRSDVRIKVVPLENSGDEGRFIIRTIEKMLGGASFFSGDSGRADLNTGHLGFGDFAVLYRLNAVGDALEQSFKDVNIPFQRVKKADPRAEAESLSRRADAVTMLTIHAAKGLEFPVVFIAGCEEKIIPYLPPGGKQTSDLDEERRLLFVAMTRACDDLYITHTRKRTLFGMTSENGASRFLTNVGPELCENMKSGRRARKKSERQYDLFEN